MKHGPFFNSNLECPMPPPAMPTKAPEGISQEMYSILHSQFSHINTELSTGRNMMNDLHAEVGKINTSLNGKDGLITKVAVMESLAKNDAANESKHSGHLYTLLGLIVSVATLLFMVFQIKSGEL